MTKWYARQQTAGADGTKTFTDRVDARQVGARSHKIIASKNVAEAWAGGDQFYVGRLRNGESLRRIIVCAGAAVTGVSLGTIASPAKYANAIAVGTADVPTTIGPNAVNFTADPLTADDYLWATVAGAVAGGVNFAIELEIAGLN
jgi:hypothetical protein